MRYIDIAEPGDPVDLVALRGECLGDRRADLAGAPGDDDGAV